VPIDARTCICGIETPSYRGAMIGPSGVKINRRRAVSRDAASS
jgi:hypothetical protein